MKQITIQESDMGLVIGFDKLPNTVLRFSIIKQRTFKDNSHLYKISAYFPAMPKHSIQIARIRGHKTDAINALKNFLKGQ